MVGSLAWGIDVRVTLRSQTEIGAAILQCKATACRDDSSPKTSIVAVDERAGITFAVGHGEVDCVAGAEDRTARLDVLDAGVTVEGFGAFREVGGVKKAFDGNVCFGWVANEAAAVRES